MSEFIELINIAMNAPTNFATVYACYSTNYEGEVDAVVNMDTIREPIEGISFETSLSLQSLAQGILFARLRINSIEEAGHLFSTKQEYSLENGTVERTFVTGKDAQPKYWRIPKTATKVHDQIRNADIYTYSRPLRPNTCVAMARLAAYYLRKDL